MSNADLRSVDRIVLVGCGTAFHSALAGEYLIESLAHIPVARYWTPAEFEELGAAARELGFAQVRSGPLVRSSYHADQQAHSAHLSLADKA